MHKRSKSSSYIRYITGSFPPPKFLSMPAAAIDISDTSIKYLDAKYSSSGYIPKKFDVLRIPSGVVSAGVVQNVDALASSLRILQKRHKRKYALVSLPEELAYLFELKVPVENKNKIREAVEFSLIDRVPLDPADATFDYDIISETNDNINVSVTVYQTSVVEGYIGALERAGFSVRGCEIEAQSIARCVVPRDFSGVAMIIDFGRTRTGITITRNQSPIFTTTAHVGGSAITKSIVDVLGVAEEEADIIKREQGIEELNNADARNAIVKTINLLIAEAERHYQFWNTHKDDEYGANDKIEKIYLCGGAVGLKGLPDLVASSLRAPVEVVNTWQNMFDIEEYIPPVSNTQSWQYTTSVGLLLRDII